MSVREMRPAGPPTPTGLPAAADASAPTGAPAGAGSPEHPAPDVNRADCPSRGVLEHVTSRWGVLVLAALLHRSYRFSELRRHVGGVSEKMLAQTLQTLERDGFVHRAAKPVIPPRVDYSLTPVGREVAERVSALTAWVEDRLDDVFTARRAYDEARDQG